MDCDRTSAVDETDPERRRATGGRGGRDSSTSPRIMQAIPHRYPFLMIDRVVDLVRNQSAIGIKNVSINESFFQGHFPTTR